jgi:Ca2+-binding EF-hand superfamily protein
VPIVLPELPKKTEKSFYQPRRNDQLSEEIRRVAQKHRDSRVVRDFMTIDEQQQLLETLKQNSTKYGNDFVLNFNQFMKAKSDSPDKIQWIFKPSIFIMIPKYANGEISCQMFHSFAVRAITLLESYYALLKFSQEFDGYVTEEELQLYIESQMPKLNLKPQSDTIRTFYICTCIRKFSFFHDKCKQGRMKIDSIVFSPILSELLELTNINLCPDLLVSNWFSSRSTLKVYQDFLKLDRNKNGMIGKQEMKFSRDEKFTNTFITQLYDNVQLFNGEMDFLIYLEFILALENLDSIEGLKWIFRILDIKKNGYLDQSTIEFYLKDVNEMMAQHGLEKIPLKDMVVFWI